MPSKKSQSQDEVESLIIQHLNRVSETWVEMIKKYSSDEKFFPDDNLYWYNERATLSTFAAALAKNGYYILEEFSDEKKQTATTENKKGRVDLWFGHPDYKNEHAYVEAKQIWIDISTVNEPALIKEINLYKEKAQSRLNKITNVYGGRRIILLFLVPCYSPKKKYKDTSKSFKESLKKFKKSLKQLEDKSFLCTECFLDQKKYEKATTWDSSRYPGVVLLGFLSSPEKKRSPKKTL